MSVNEKKIQEKIEFVPHNTQKLVLDSKSREVAICAGRGWGKSMHAAYEIVRFFLNALNELKKGQRTSIKIWIVAPTYELSGKVFSYVVEFLLRFDKSFSQFVTNRPIPQIKLSETVWIQGKSATEPNSLLGERLDLLVVDEAARISKVVYERNLFPTTSSKLKKAKTIFISTPFGKNWFYNKWIEAKNTGGAFHFTSKDGVEISEDEWQRAKSMLPEQVFKQEYEAAFLDDAASVFRNIKGSVRDNCLKDSSGGRYYTMGVDLGKHEDFTVLTVIDRDSHEVVYWDRFNKIDYTLQKKRIKEVADRYNNARIYIDSTVVGEPIAEDLAAVGLFVDDYKFSMKSKKELVEKLSIFIEQQKVFIPNKTELIDELEAFGYRLTDAGNIVYSAPEGLHDDCVYSLALAVWGLDNAIEIPLSPIQKEMEKVKKNIKRESYI